MDANRTWNADLELDLIGKLGPKPRRNFGKGVVGAGLIIRYGHLPAYQALGLRVIG